MTIFNNSKIFRNQTSNNQTSNIQTVANQYETQNHLKSMRTNFCPTKWSKISIILHKSVQLVSLPLLNMKKLRVCQIFLLSRNIKFEWQQSLFNFVKNVQRWISFSTFSSKLPNLNFIILASYYTLVFKNIR